MGSRRKRATDAMPCFRSRTSPYEVSLTLLRLLQVVDLGRQIVPPQRDAEQELHPGHDPVAIADAEAALDQVQLKAANVVGGGSVGRFASRTRGPANIRLCAMYGRRPRCKRNLTFPRMVGCGHVFGLLLQPLWPLAMM